MYTELLKQHRITSTESFYEDYAVARWLKNPPGMWETTVKPCFKQD